MPILRRSTSSYHFFIDLHLKSPLQMIYTFVIIHSEVLCCLSVPLEHNTRKTLASSPRAQIHFIPLVGSGSNRFLLSTNHFQNDHLFMTYRTTQYVEPFHCDSVLDAISSSRLSLFDRLKLPKVVGFNSGWRSVWRKRLVLIDYGH
jgi:hypothetical protein